MTEPTPSLSPEHEAASEVADDLYVHRSAATVARAHLTRYPRHYGALGLFLAAMVLVPSVADSSAGDSQPSSFTGQTATPRTVVEASPPDPAPAVTTSPEAEPSEPEERAPVASPLGPLDPSGPSGPSDLGTSDRGAAEPAPTPAPPGPTPEPPSGDDGSSPPEEPPSDEDDAGSDEDGAADELPLPDVPLPGG